MSGQMYWVTSLSLQGKGYRVLVQKQSHILLYHVRQKKETSLRVVQMYVIQCGLYTQRFLNLPRNICT